MTSGRARLRDAIRQAQAARFRFAGELRLSADAGLVPDWELWAVELDLCCGLLLSALGADI